MRALLVCMAAATVFWCSPSDNWAADPEVKFNLLALPSVRVAAEQLDAPAQVFGDRITLRTTVAQLAEVYQFSYWIDRQVDADKPLSLPRAETTLGQCLARLAQQCDAEVGLVENVVTIAARDRLASMQYTAVRLHDHLSRGSVKPADLARGGANAPNAASGANAAQLRPLSWPMLTTPTELYQEIAKTWGFRPAAELPHDLMNAGGLHPCTVATQLTLLFGGFDRCAVGRQLGELRIAAMPKAGPWQAVYSEVPEVNIAAVTSEFPDAKLERAGKQVVLSGSTAAHLRLLHSPPRAAANGTARNAAGSPSPTSPTRGGRRQRTGSKEESLLKQRYTIKQDRAQPLHAVMSQLASQLGLELKWSEGLAP
ncbi:MAG: hypothetical protein ACTHK7_04165, partial [Aureliella sp.]